jgi:ferredoxin
MKIQVNFDLCASNAICMAMAPEVFEVRDDGYLYILNDNPGPELDEKVRDAVNGCPTGAISLAD